MSGCGGLVAGGAASSASAPDRRGDLEQLVETSHNHHEPQRRLEQDGTRCGQNTTQIRREPREVSEMWLVCKIPNKKNPMNQKLHRSVCHEKKDCIL